MTKICFLGASTYPSDDETVREFRRAHLYQYRKD